jgi:hypothetical protein
MTAKENVQNLLYKMTPAEQNALVQEICRICEKQYRKGYQHGVGDSNEGLVTKAQANQFRYDGIAENYSKVVYPPFFKQKCDPVGRVSPELAMADMEILNTLFGQAETKRL